MLDERELTADERATLLRILREASFAGASELAAQVDQARVIGGIPTLLDLAVKGSPQASSVRDGPIPVRTLVGTEEAPEGEILVWVKDGFLSGLEFAWFTDDPPSAFPPAERLLDWDAEWPEDLVGPRPG